MSHPEQVEFCKKVKKMFPKFFSCKLVVDIGSLDINGNNRFLFENCTYLGVDIADGNNVDLITKAQDLNLPNDSVDVIISTECLEHDMFYQQTLLNMYRILKPGGLFIFTCATEGRKEHGTSRSTPEDAPLIQDNLEWKDYYKNLTENHIREVFSVEKLFKNFHFEVNSESYDLYFYGFKMGEFKPRNNIYYSENTLNTIIQLQDVKLKELTSSLSIIQSAACKDADEINYLKAELELSRNELNAVRPHYNYMCEQLHYMENSLSWKITRPVRFVRHLRRKVKNKIKDVYEKRHILNFSNWKFFEKKEKLNPFEKIVLLPHVDCKFGLDDQLRSQRNKFDIICFSIIEWDFRYQRPQQIMSQFALNGHRVFYINPAKFLNPDSTKQKLQVTKINKYLYHVKLASLEGTGIYDEVFSGNKKNNMLQSLDALRKKFKIEHAISYLMLPSWHEVTLAARNKWGWSVIYDCIDEWEGFPGINQRIVDAEHTLVNECNLLIVTAKKLYDKWQNQCQSIVLARNAADYKFYEEHYSPNNLLANKKHPIVGYYGAIADWFDLNLAIHLAKYRPKYTFVYVGGVFGVDLTELKKFPNVIITGQQQYELMPKYLYHFDVCHIPFKINPITEATDPVKLYEYFCGGKPVVSVALPEVEIYKDYMYIAADYEDFLQKLDLAVQENQIEWIVKRKEIASENTWNARYRQIVEAFKNTVPSVSIIIVTYNNLMLTQLCIESILRNTEYPNYEIIVIDNNSSDQTRAYLKLMTLQLPNFHIILNNNNLGFATANNQGIRLSKADYIVLLNNDTVVPPGWLDRLLWHLRDPSVGMVGPVSNQVGNEAKIDVSYGKLSEMIKFAKEHTWNYEDDIGDIHMLGMFCVAITSEVIKKIGLLDEQFGIGMFEDDDYAHRVKLAGYKVICAKDVFIHHVGSASFKKLDSIEFNVHFEKNRNLFETKWDTKWAPKCADDLKTRKTKFSRQLTQDISLTDNREI